MTFLAYFGDETWNYKNLWQHFKNKTDSLFKVMASHNTIEVFIWRPFIVQPYMEVAYAWLLAQTIF